MGKLSGNRPRSSFWLRYRGLVFQALLLAAVWILISGRFEPDYLAWGAVSIALVLWLNSKLRSIPLAENEPSGSSHIDLPRLTLYLLWLVWQMVKSGFYVAYIILHPRMPIQPVIVRFTSEQPNVIARVILGNSITLTPGTLTLEIKGNRFVVHALTHDTDEDPFSGRMGAKVCKLYRRECDRELVCRDLEVITSGRAT
jgi:multicomponent Na+:H+ antiporter subunit E